jgi:sigma-54 specific flagellar transcriptional regulator A
MEMQVKLLRALQERCVLPVGASKEVPIDVKVIAATHRHLEAEVSSGRFREDLYYRLNVLPIQTTPLRERNEDVPLLLNHYAERFALKSNRPVTFSAELMLALSQYAWPGNVRELSNLVDRFSTLFPGQLLALERIPTCMLPKGLAELQRVYLQDKLGRSEIPLSILHEAEPATDVPQVPMPQGAQWPSKPTVFVDGDQGEEFFHLLSDLPSAEPSLTDGSEPVKVIDTVEASNDEINSVEQAIFLGQGIQTLPPDGISLKQHLIEIERSLIEQALSRTKGNVSKTAKLLQLQRTTLIEKINKYELRSSG